VLAHHYTEAGMYEQAHLSWQRAGARWMGRSAYHEAVTCLEQALAALAISFAIFHPCGMFNR
jgi:hypothetical protein